MPKLCILIIVALWAHQYIFAQPSSTSKPYSIIIKGGHVIDPKNSIDAIMDIAIAPGLKTGPIAASMAILPEQVGKIALVAKNIDSTLAVKVVHARGLYVTPGLIDIHSHNFWGHDGSYQMNSSKGLLPDGFSFRSGVTTVVDAGGSGWQSFPLLKKQTIDRSQTRVLAMLNIVGQGMAGSVVEQDVNNMDAEKTAAMAKQYPDLIVGIKLAHFNGHTWTPVDRATQAGRIADLPVMVDFGSATPFLPLDSLFNVKFRTGDIYTHAFGGNSSTSPNGRESIVDVTTRRIKPFVLEARKKGIIFDVGFGAASFLFSQGIPAIAGGFFPNSISTDLHAESMNNALKDMPNIMSLFMAMGMNVQQVIQASTWNPAREIKHEELGSLSVGSVADIALFNLTEGQFGFWARDGKIAGTKRLQPEMTIRAGHIVYDLNGRVD